MNANGMTGTRAAGILEPGVVAQIARAVAAPRAHRATHGRWTFTSSAVCGPSFVPS